MNELTNSANGKKEFHWQLLTSVSALALVAMASGLCEATAADEDADRPTVWIELGGQLEQMSGEGEKFPVGFMAANPNSPVLKPTPLQAQNPPPFNFGEEGRITFQPKDSDWVFSASLRYGRNSNFNHVKHQTNRVFTASASGSKSVTSVEKFSDTQVHWQKSYAVLDFSAGKDVGLGLFGRDGASVLSLGVRFAQFASKSTFDVRARPDVTINYKYLGSHKLPKAYFDEYHATGSASRSFHGVGPAMSWTNTVPVGGSSENGELSLDWGANAALLFGKQKTRVQHAESAVYKPWGHFPEELYQRSGEGHNTARSIIAPNVGGFAGASYRIENFKVSAGYRADFFFGAIDGGIDARKSEPLGFYGPFATISVGLGG